MITDDGPTINSARVVLTNASAGDVLSAVGLPGGIAASVDTSVAGQITLTLTGNASPANYQTAIQQVRYNNTSQNPDPAARVLQVTVNDGPLDSAVATTTITVAVPQNDVPATTNDTILTNLAAAATISVSAAALLANDTDPEGQAVTISSVGGAIGLATGPALAAGVVTLSDNATANGSFTYIASEERIGNALLATVNLNRVGTANLTGGAAGEIIIGNAAVNTIAGGGGNDNINAGEPGDSSISGGTGNDIIAAGTGNDNITWNANASGDTDGFDIIDGQAGGIDTFALNGRAGTAETFRIYTRVEALAAGIAVVGANSEIVITRTVLGDTTVIAELDNIEEITVGTLITTANNGTPHVARRRGQRWRHYPGDRRLHRYQPQLQHHHHRR